ncbi:MAG: hypothetical protein JNG88_03960 [Phycisphaerales bacterium]|nr:hypothetical protein [Phycisphaerales bacterium]
MRIEVELSKSAQNALRALSDGDQDDFFARLDNVAEKPMTRSSAHVELGLPDRRLRRFEFGVGVVKIAIFELDAQRQRMRVLKCRPLRPRTIRDAAQPES